MVYIRLCDRVGHSPELMNILIVDDEPALVEYLTKTVNAYYPSHKVRGAVSAKDAIFAAHEEGAVDLLIADIHLGDSDGFEVCSQLQPIFPGMQTVFISGRSNRTFQNSEDGIRNFLRKPLGPNDIFGAVEALQQKVRPRTARRVIPRSLTSNSVTMSASECPVAFRRHNAIDSPKSTLANEACGNNASVAEKILVDSAKHPIWLPALLSLLTLGVVITLILRDTRLLDHVRQSPINETAAASRVTLRDLPSQLHTPSEPEFQDSVDKQFQTVTLSDQFEGSDRPLELEAQWKILPLAVGAHEIVVGEGAVRARASDLVVALFTAGVVSPYYNWVGNLDMGTNETGRIGFVFGYLNPEDYYLLTIDRTALRTAVVRRMDGDQETLWDAALPENVVSSEFHVRLGYDGVEQTLMITLGKSEVVARIALEGFEGGHFGLSVAETSFSRFSGFELTLTPETLHQRRNESHSTLAKNYRTVK